MKKLIPLCLFLFIIPSIIQAQLNWQYRYTGPWNGEDHANSIACGPAGNVYVAGSSYGFNPAEMVVLSLTAGDTNWVFRYCEPPDSNDQAYAICYGDDNIYFGGYGPTVISLSTAGGVNWIFRDSIGGGYTTRTNAIVYADSTIFVTGSGFRVISLRPTGDTNWVRNPAYGNAYAIDVGSNQNIYACGRSNQGAAVASITFAGDTNWVRFCPHNGSQFQDVVCGLDGDIYAAGYYYEYLETTNLIVWSFNAPGDTNWTYKYDSDNQYPYDYDEAGTLMFGADSNIYVAGNSRLADGTGCIIVISLDRSGGERWVRNYPGGMMTYYKYGKEIVWGPDDYIYVAGWSGEGEFQILKLDTLGNVVWTYHNNGSGNGMDIAAALDFGDDGNLYAAGRSHDSLTNYDILVVSIGPDGNVDDSQKSRWVQNYGSLCIWPNPARDYCTIRFAHPTGNSTIRVFDAAGRLVNYYVLPSTLRPESSDLILSGLAPGVYFVQVDGVRAVGKIVITE